MDSGRRGKKRPCPKPSTAPAGPSPTREEDDQEGEMEEFYALVGRIREMRDMLRSSAGTRLAKAAAPLWKPAFKLEDFRHHDEAESSAAALVEPPKEEKRRNEEEVGKEECGIRGRNSYTTQVGPVRPRRHLLVVDRCTVNEASDGTRLAGGAPMFAAGAVLSRRRASSELLRQLRRTTSVAPPQPPSLSTVAATADGIGPPPIRVSLTESAGRGVFATRGIAAGELIHSAQPLVAHPSPSLLDKVPFLSLSLLISESLLSTCLLTCSCEYWAFFQGFYEVEKGLDWTLFDDHCRFAGALNSCVLTKEWYINVLARIRINAFRIELVAKTYEEMLTSAAAFIAADAAVGNAIYMLPSFYNHDCGKLSLSIFFIDFLTSIL
ncbi:hypothetical protein BHM03_00042334 [Ensete ventricosum]|nr:hypothetical protein BHM03_00042334 [Ensete ventricosum]